MVNIFIFIKKEKQKRLLTSSNPCGMQVLCNWVLNEADMFKTCSTLIY